MKLKTLLIGLIALVISFQTFATTETKYYPTGEVDQVQEYVNVNGNKSKTTFYHKTGEVKEVGEYVDGKRSKVTGYYKTGKVEQILDFVNSKESKKPTITRMEKLRILRNTNPL